MSDEIRLAIAAFSMFGGILSLLCSALCVYWALDARKSAGRELFGEDDEPT